MGELFAEPASRPELRYASTLIPGLQQIFPSANQALNWMKEQGIGVRRQNFLWEWGAQLKAEATRNAHFTATLEAYPASSAIVDRRSPKARGYQLLVQHLIEDPESGELYWTWGAWRGQRLTTYAEMIAGAEEQFLQGQLEDERYPQGNLIGTRAWEMRQYLPELPEDVEAG